MILWNGGVRYHALSKDDIETTKICYSNISHVYYGVESQFMWTRQDARVGWEAYDQVQLMCSIPNYSDVEYCNICIWSHFTNHLLIFG